MNVCTKWAFHLELLTKNDWTKRSMLCDQMGLDKITLKRMLNFCLCRWKINQNESNYWSHLLVQLLEIHTTHAFVYDFHFPGNSWHSLISLYQHYASNRCQAISNHHANQGKTRTTRMPAFWGYPALPHDCPYYWFILDPKSKENKVKVTNLKNLPKNSNYLSISKLQRLYF